MLVWRYVFVLGRLCSFSVQVPASTRRAHADQKSISAFYLFVIVASGVAMLLSWRSDSFSAAWMAFVMLTTLGARQILMPAINRATDLGHKKRFLWLHGFSVLLTLGHIVLAGVVLVHMTY